MQNVSCNKYLSSTSSISFQSKHKRSCRATSRDTSKLQNLLATSCASNHRNSDRAYHRTKSEFGGCLQLRTFAALWSLENRRLNCWHSRLQTVSTWEASEPVRCCQSNGYIACRGAKLKFANSKETLGMIEMIWKWLKRKSWQWVHCARNLLCQDLTLKLGSLVTNKRIWIRDADVTLLPQRVHNQPLDKLCFCDAIASNDVLASQGKSSQGEFPVSSYGMLTRIYSGSKIQNMFKICFKKWRKNRTRTITKVI